MSMSDFSQMSLTELEMSAVEWRRWRNRVRSQETMRHRYERDAEAHANLTAIQREIELRSAEGRERMLKALAEKTEAIVGVGVVSLDAYRELRRERETINRRR